MNAPDTKSNEQHDERPLLSHTLSKASMTSTDLPPDTITLQKSLSIRTQSSQRGFGREPARRMRVSRREMLLSPPFLAIVFAAAFANVRTNLVQTHIAYRNTHTDHEEQIPELPEAFLSQDGPLSPFKQAIDLLGRVVVPASSLIVGARLHAYYTTVCFHFNPSSRASSDHSQQTLNAAKPSAFLLSSIVVTRFLFLPFIGRLLYQILDVPAFVSDPLLRIYMLIPYFMPTASNSVVMVQMVAAGVPNIAERMEGVLLACIFWQYATAPLFLTANMALGLMLVFREE